MNHDQTAASEAVAAKNLFGRLLRFALSGVLSTALYFLLATLAAYLIEIDPVIASCLAYLTCVVVSYLLQSRYTFRVRGDPTAQIAKFLTVSVVGLAVSTLVMKWAVDVQGLSYWLGALFVAGVIPIANFVIFSIWVFVHR